MMPVARWEEPSLDTQSRVQGRPGRAAPYLRVLRRDSPSKLPASTAATLVGPEPTAAHRVQAEPLRMSPRAWRRQVAVERRLRERLGFVYPSLA